MLIKPQMTIGIFSRKLIALLLGLGILAGSFFYFRDSYPIISLLIIFPGAMLTQYTLDYSIYDVTTKRYELDVRIFEEKKLQKKYESVKARQSGSVNDNIAKYKKKKSIW
jgi:hypothetical protein